MLKFTRLTHKQLFILVGLILAIIISIFYSALRDNIHTVIPNQLYRSAQLSPQSIQHLVHLKKIKTMINLRGNNANESWYQQEINTSSALKLKHYDIALNSKRPPTQAQLIQLIDLLEHAPKPILIHCESGVDRTGFVAAMALILLKDEPLNQAEQQFSLRYLVLSSHSVGKLVFAEYHAWLTAHHLASSKHTFKVWVEAAYTQQPKHA